MNKSRIRLGDLSVGLVLPLISALQAREIDPAPLLLRFGLDPTFMTKAQAQLSIPRYMRLGHAALQCAKDPAFGLEIGRFSHPAQLGLVGITALQAPTIREAARLLIDHERLYVSSYRGHSQFEEASGGAWLNFYSISPYNNFNRFMVDQVLAGWVTQLSHIAGRPLKPTKVTIEYPMPDGAERYVSTFGCPVEFAASRNAVHFNAATLNEAVAPHYPITWHQLLELCQTELQRATSLHSVRERVVFLLGPLLKDGEPSLEDIAKRLQLPAWTLRRKLAEEGTRYLDILNETRRELAISYVRETDLTFNEISYVLGFSSAAAFQRAFKRWTNLSPGIFRRTWRNQGEIITL
ncbi:AraC-like DNA-binding protein [Pseudomonas duriflava]|uniref:AraC-like DNA-binding protein n=1 Tax=Pseudomonas duriflava TaxID=459528 RepID=A0A562Q8L6_9PSED|nr:AraC family transcriptional regulator [Pseudomonas duriflava]TWI53097.1 AraC-like DNA-binding protein [Pseudomonas duriflava]